MSKKAWITIGAIALVIIVAITLLKNPQEHKPTSTQESKPTVRICLVAWPGLGPFHLAEHLGYYKEEGIDVEILYIEQTEARRAALASGDVDLVGITLDSVVESNANGIPEVVVGLTDISSGGDGIIAKKSIRTIADLKGKTVALAEATPSHFFLLYLMQKDGLTPKDFKLIPTQDPGQAGAHFAAGKVDAAVTWEPWLSKAQNMGNGHVLADSKLAPNLIIGIVSTNRDRLPQRREYIKKALKAWYRAIKYWKKHPKESNAVMAKAFEIPTEEFEAILTGTEIKDYSQTIEFFGTQGVQGPIYDVAQKCNEIWLEAGVIKQPVKTDIVIDPSLVHEIGSDIF